MKEQRQNARLRVAMIARREATITGTSRFVSQLTEELMVMRVGVRVVHPEPPPIQLTGLGRRMGIDLARFGTTYPMRVVAPRAGDVDVYHLATQNLATLLLLRRFERPVVVTVHDIIPYLTRHDRRLSSYRHAVHRFFDLLAMWGLKRADLLLAVSAWTKETLIQHLGIAPDRIQVTYQGVDTERFLPRQVTEDFWHRYGLDPRRRHLLYVGSDDPRKNLESMLRAFAIVSRGHPDLGLVRAGAVYRPGEANRLNALSQELGIGGKVMQIGHVSDDDLTLFYNAADLVILPSHFEGFGLPVLESLACETRVVCSNTASLPEIAGADCVICSPTADAIARAVIAALADDGAAVRESRRQWASQFSWQRTAQQVRDAYARIGESARCGQ